jgi:hypothetical protein
VMIDRREFMSGTALVALAPTLSLLPVVLPTPAAETNRLVMKIYGWSTPGQSGTDEEVWIRVNRSWRTAWR